MGIRVAGKHFFRPDDVEFVFSRNKEPDQILMGLLGVFIPQIENLEKYTGRPKIGKASWYYIAGKFQEINALKLWEIKGFKKSVFLKGWQFSLSRCEFFYRR